MGCSVFLCLSLFGFGYACFGDVVLCGLVAVGTAEVAAVSIPQGSQRGSGYPVVIERSFAVLASEP